MKHTFCGLTRLLLLVAFGALAIGWYRDLGAVAESRGRTVPEGMRLVSVRCVPRHGSLQSGNRVDVMVRASGEHVTLLQDVKVWSVSERADTQSGVAPATLLVTEEQAHILAEHLPSVALARYSTQ